MFYYSFLLFIDVHRYLLYRHLLCRHLLYRHLLYRHLLCYLFLRRPLLYRHLIISKPTWLSPRPIRSLSTGRRLHLRGGICMTASKAFPQVDGKDTSKANPIDTSATYRAGDRDFVNFFTCSYHYRGSVFTGCMGGGSQGNQLTFSITAVATDKYTNTEIIWNRCSSAANCLATWPEMGKGTANGGSDDGTIGGGTAYGGDSDTYWHQMGSTDPSSYATSRCGSKDGRGGLYFGYCNNWHRSNFDDIGLDSGETSTMNNAGSSGIHDSLMVNPSRQATKYWSSSGKSGGASKNMGGGLDIDKIATDYGHGWYRTTIGGFGCETQTDTTWFRIKSGSCAKGQKCSDDSTGSCAATCVTCKAGQYGKDGKSCQLCNAGKYHNSQGQTAESACKPCSNGHGSSRGANTCTRCAAGQKASSGAACTNCGVGQMSKAEAKTCSACTAGYSCRRFNLFLYRKHNTVPTNSHVLTFHFFLSYFFVFVCLLLCLVFLLRTLFFFVFVLYSCSFFLLPCLVFCNFLLPPMLSFFRSFSS